METSNAFLEYNTLFTTFGTQHLVMLALTTGAAVALPLYANRFLSVARRLLVARILAAMLSLTVIVWVALRVVLLDPLPDPVVVDVADDLLITVPRRGASGST